MKQTINFNESDLEPIKQLLDRENRGKKWNGKVSNQSAIDEAVRISNICLKFLCPLDLVNLRIAKPETVNLKITSKEIV